MSTAALDTHPPDADAVSTAPSRPRFMRRWRWLAALLTIEAATELPRWISVTAHLLHTGAGPAFALVLAWRWFQVLVLWDCWRRPDQRFSIRGILGRGRALAARAIILAAACTAAASMMAH